MRRWCFFVCAGIAMACTEQPVDDDPAPDRALPDAAADMSASDPDTGPVDATVRMDLFERVVDAAVPDAARFDAALPDAAPDLDGPLPDLYVPPDCEPVAEACNDADDDCDGRVDEGFGVGAPCAVGVGACAAPGVVACVDGAAVCAGEPGEPGAEACSGRDEDCDGRVDEGLPEMPCYSGPDETAMVGACRPGVTACIAGTQVCRGQMRPGPELCDGGDGDCDGAIDEGCARCGDGLIDPGEDCDDGNRDAGDGCAPNCAFEGARTEMISGIQRDVAIDDVIARGWTPCYTGLYNVGGLDLDTVLEGCAGSQLLIGCRPTGADTLRLAAEGLFEEVTADVGGGQQAVNRHNGVDFYFSRSASWGFAPPGDGVFRNTCDTAQQDDPERMCWHTIEGNFRGGWRCGTSVRLNESGAFERLIFTRRDVELGPSRGFGHHGDCGSFNACVDAAGCAEAACAHFDQGEPVSWREGRCLDVPGLDCDLFTRAPAELDTAWTPGCDMPAAFDVVCAGGAPPVCGDGRVDPNEECDDGGIAPGDGCSARCTVEVPLEGFEGIRQGVSVSSLELGGFRVCHTETYDTLFDADAVRGRCGGADWVVGCRPVGGGDLLTVAAMGQQDVIFDPVAAEAGASREHNGARWYYTDDFSFGFAPIGGGLGRNPCDTAQDQPEQRLCWHTIERGGWRCGATTGLNDDAGWERVVLDSGGF